MMMMMMMMIMMMVLMMMMMMAMTLTAMVMMVVNIVVFLSFRFLIIFNVKRHGHLVDLALKKYFYYVLSYIIILSCLYFLSQIVSIPLRTSKRGETLENTVKFCLCRDSSNNKNSTFFQCFLLSHYTIRLTEST